MVAKKSKELVILYILKKWGFLIDFDDKSFLNYKKSPSLHNNDTFKEWKKKVFNDPNAAILVYCKSNLGGNTRFKNVKNSAKSIKEVIKQIESLHEEEKNNEIRKIEANKIIRKIISTPSLQQIIKNCLSDLKQNDDLEFSVEQFFERLLTQNPNLQTTLKKLIGAYNHSVKEYREIINQKSPNHII